MFPGFKDDPSIFVDVEGRSISDSEITDLRLVIPRFLSIYLFFARDRLDDETDGPEVMQWFFEWYGVEAIFKDLNAVVVHQDTFGTLWEVGRWDEDGNAFYDEIMRAVEVVDATPQPDGTFKRYFLMVPPEIRTAREAVAWTFGFARAEDYAPEAET